ncbi:NTP transferase domain-containing protein [Massilia sp. 9096]|uniref:NTP transferase domain-containing protein n=1 Tax=Massilia sp. 9096 TaxID=1500894 RepID=UPI00056229BF|nr:NTP transferase domain-containing protein [Massilia sp. 9096]
MIVIPMAGQSRRFREAGYVRPKYELPLQGESLFARCVRSFERYFDSESFLFIARREFEAERFIATECERLGIRDYRTVTLDRPTRGQAETVLLGLRQAQSDSNAALLIFNIDTIRPGYAFPPEALDADGYLDVVRADGEHWSFVRPAATFTRRVAETSEKRRISALCCTGLYCFARAADFTAACEAALYDADDADDPDKAGSYLARWGEAYIAPLYNDLIAAGKHIVYAEVQPAQVLFAGTPADYEALLRATRSPS